MSEWWPAILGLYLLWSWHRYGIREERVEVYVSTMILDLLAMPGWGVTIGVYLLVRYLLRDWKWPSK